MKPHPSKCLAEQQGIQFVELIKMY